MDFMKGDSRAEFLAAARIAREERAYQERQILAAIKIQAGAKGFLARTRVYRQIRTDFDSRFEIYKELDKSLSLLPASDAFVHMNRLMFIFKNDKDKERFSNICRYLILSLDCADIKNNFTSLAVNKTTILSYLSTMKRILWQSCKYFDDLRPEMPSDAKSINLHLQLLVLYTACNSWALLKSKQGEAFRASMQQLCSNILGDLCAKGFFTKISKLLKKGLFRNKPIFKPATVSAAVSLAIRPLVGSSYSENMLTQFTISILSVPALVLHLNTLSQECVTLLITHKIFVRVVELLTSEKSSKAVFESGSLDGSYSLSVLANLIHLGFFEKQILLEHLLDFTNASTRLLDHCSSRVVNTKSNMTHWHPVLGWYSQSLDSCLQENIPFVTQQLQLLWNGSTVKCLFSDLVNLVPESLNAVESFSIVPQQMPTSSTKSSSTKDMAASVQKLLKKVFDQKHSSNKDLQISKRLGSPETTIVSLVCTLYQQALATLTQLKFDILSGLCYQDFLLPRLWHFISSLGAQNGLKAFLDLLIHNPKATSPEFQILVLFADCATYLITILDDIEVYEQQKPFSLETLKCVAQFCNSFMFKVVWENLIDVRSVSNNHLFTSVHSLMSLLYSRDCRRSYCGNLDFWLIKDIKPSTFLAELDKSNKKAELLIRRSPHIIPHKDRVVLFRKYVSSDKETLGLTHADSLDRPSTLISIHRNRIVEDGYRQLSLLPVKSLKGVVRVKFVNEQGLDEPGIDQDGVFKEFLEETIKKVFDPSLNLFRATSESRLYPSSTSSVHENHLALFDFVGRMLGKAVYEGIVVEIPFATFVLNHILGRVGSGSYSSIDELPSLDPDLYKSLTYIKHYEGDVSELELTFSCDEDYMGQLVTHELAPGGKTIPVTNENRISYIHLMAHFRMYVQIKDQLTAFVRGFRSLINQDWLCLFSPPELQKLISGDTEDIDLSDLRQHVQYYGGFHNNHRVINWLWEILANDYTAEERRLFLKFVTSCSKPPLLGFSYLVPPFSIRCVEVADDQDEGDTLGSVIRGFLAIRKKDPIGRLPTASTCFNLLKLPNYQKKSTLREKLRYAIHSGTGFELS